MNRVAELAQAARRIKSLSDRLPEHLRIDDRIGSSWEELLASVDGASDWRFDTLVSEWTERWETRLSGRLLHAPLEVPRG